MHAPTPEQQFARFRDDGDLNALAAVFDAVAGQLLLVAGHLVRDGATAEDLVQTTFVEAMRSAARYDARRPLLPWLSQLLTHHAAKLHRQRRRGALAQPVERADERPAVDRVLDREALAAIEAGLARLPARYRQVLTLRLVHDLSPVAIAHAIGCPPDTVKTRLKRGLERLRRHLPTGLATGLAVLLAPGRGLAAMRRDVLWLARHGAARPLVGAGGGAAVGVFLVGGFLMQQFLMRATLVVAVLALGWLGFVALRPAAAAPLAAAPPAAPAVAQLPAGDAAPAAERVAGAAPPPAARDEIVFLGRCVAAGSRAPLPDVTAVARSRHGDPAPDSALAALPTAGRTSSAADGTFELRCELDRAAIYDVRVGRTEHVHRVRAFGPFAEPRVVELGDIELERGVALSLRTVDRCGAPVPDVSFTLSRAGTIGRRDMLMLESGSLLRSDEIGEVRLPCAVSPGLWEVWWSGDDVELPSARLHSSMVVPVAVERHHLDLVWPVEDVRQAITGAVVDAAGRPQPRLILGAEGGGTRGNTRTAADGTFRMPRIGPYDAAATGPVRFGLPEPTCGLELVGEPECRWGDRAVRVVVRPAATACVRVVEAETGAPVSDFEIAGVARCEGGELAIVRPRPGAIVVGSDGSWRRALSARPHDLQVLPADRRLAPSFVMQWDPARDDELVVALPTLRRATVRVVSATGVPVAGTRVVTLLPIEAVAGAPSAGEWREVAVPDPEQHTIDPTTRWLRHGIDDAWLGEARTGPDGRASVLVRGDADVVIAALGPGHVPIAVTGRLLEGAEHELRVGRGAQLHLLLTPPDVVARLLPSPSRERLAADSADYVGVGGAGVRLRRVCGDGELATATLKVRMTPDGRCECSHLPAGVYDVYLDALVDSGPGDGISGWWPLPQVTLRDGELLEVPVDVSRWATARLRGQVLVNGGPWPCAFGTLWAHRADGHTRVHVQTDANGRFDVEVASGTYGLQLLGNYEKHAHLWFAEETIEVARAADATVVFTARDVCARVRVVHADGTPAAWRRVTTDYDTTPSGWVEWRTDADGWFTMDRAPGVPFHLTVARETEPEPERAGRRTRPAGEATFGPFRVPPSGDRAEFRIELPAGFH